MADLTPVIETMENRWMRAWVQLDVKTLKSMTSKDFILLTASRPAMILDRPSWLEAVARRYDCLSFAFGDIYVREWGSTALFTAPLELKATIDDEKWSGPLFVTDLWRRGRVRRGWKLVQRVVSKTDDDPRLAKTIRALQLWK
jgi:ketosteroid isomerase-like protein